MTEETARINTLVPMVNLKGERAIVNSWDVDRRKADGWSLDDDADQWNGSTKSPNHDRPKGVAAPVAPLDPAAERARVKAIARAADEDQEALADKLIADGVPEADALKALAADRAAKKAKTAKPAKGDAEKPAAPQA